MKAWRQHGAILVCAALAVVFVAWPQLDLIVSQWFYDPSLPGWPLANHPINEAIYWVFRYLPHFIIPIMLIVIGLSFVRGGVSPKHRKPWLFLLLVLLIGPGLLVHSVFKEGFQRERPRAVEQFGGSDAFTPAFVINQKSSGKSFVSGHSAMAFYFMALAWIFRRRSWLYWGIALGVIMSAVRIMQGGHFLSDTIFAGFLVYFTCRGISWWLLGHSRIRPDKNA
ncbi:phosphatase PAP2 family protein [Bacterioplanes sanyensis]|uniref:phosphatase PAP2 family protein n=1 Tax=Bacterioplanes sanyensis TaxID=1249553 RepID=UPI001677C11A|nr:phosphatase PAP2 family protein [Bacterioplanes sanyensis]GGY44852.1 phosphatase PAP2 family protein [Bacterioplanes sanyensis]